MAQVKIGDYVTGYGSGYWQLIDIKPKIADEDYVGEKVRWKKGDVIGQWAILKKCFTAKMKPRIDFSYEDSAWINPVPSETALEIEKYFAEHPEYKQKFDNAEIKLTPMITNCWLDLPEDKEADFRNALENLSDTYTIDDFWETAKKYKEYISKPSSAYLLNLFTYPWSRNKNGEILYSAWELIKK